MKLLLWKTGCHKCRKTPWLHHMTAASSTARFNQKSEQRDDPVESVCFSWPEACKRCSAAMLQGTGVRIWVWPQITHEGSQLLQRKPAVYEFCLKSNMRTTPKDNFQSVCSSQFSSCTSEASNNTSLKSELKGQNRRVGVISSENVFT